MSLDLKLPPNSIKGQSSPSTHSSSGDQSTVPTPPSVNGSLLGAAEPLAPTRSRVRTQARSKNPNWTQEEDRFLTELMTNKQQNQNQNQQQSEPRWQEVAVLFPGKNAHQVADRWAKVLNPSLVKGSWNGEEDAQIVKWVTENGPKNWGALAALLPGRISKQCRERWHNHLSPDVNKKDWTPEEDQILIERQKKWGNKWSQIAADLPGRTDNAVKNRWNSSLKRRLERIERGQSPSGKRGRKPKRPSEAPNLIVADDMPKPNIDDNDHFSTTATINALNTMIKNINKNSYNAFSHQFQQISQNQQQNSNTNDEKNISNNNENNNINIENVHNNNNNIKNNNNSNNNYANNINNNNNFNLINYNNITDNNGYSGGSTNNGGTPTLGTQPVPNLSTDLVSPSGMHGNQTPQFSPTLPSPLTPVKFLFSPGWSPAGGQSSINNWTLSLSPFMIPGGEQIDKNDLVNIPGPKLDE